MWNCFKAAQGGRKSSSNRDSPPGTSVYLHGGLNWNGQLLPSPNLIIFSFEELKKATNNFGSNTVIGEGRFGKVFKGWIDDISDSKNGSGYFVAVKRYHLESIEEWQSEVNLLGRISHPNLVKLLGYCREEKELLLIYEFMQQGSLESHLFGRGSAVQPLSWNSRLKIVLGAACGLAFLHSSQQIIYRDFKASHILLDGNYNAKLSDFSLAMNGPMGGISPMDTQVLGTYGYAAPEYVATGQVHVKSDVYGFGVVLLEMLTGQRALDTNRPSVQYNWVDWSKSSLSHRRKLVRIMDPRLEGQYPSKGAIQAAQLTLKCLGPDPRARPHMKEVVDSLERIQAIKSKTKESRTTTRHHYSHHPAHNEYPFNPNDLDRAQLLVATEIVGQSVRKTAKLILEYLMDPMIGIIGIYGMGGIGKTTAMMNINAQLAKTEAFDRIIWVTVSKVWCLDDVQNEIAKQLKVSLPVYVDEVHQASLLGDMLKKVKYLIILDDIWEPIPLEKVGIPQPSIENGCKVVLTTRSEILCHYMSTDKSIYIEGLSDEEAWDLFVSKAGNQVLTPDIRPIASKVVGECLSHPLVIITIAHALRECSSFLMWENAFIALRSSKTKIEDPEEVIYKLLRFGYSRLKNHMVQQCFLYCAFFPEDYLFEPSELIRYWMAEGFVNHVGDIISEINEGFRTLKELKDASVLHVFKHHFRMHAIFRGLAIDIMRDQQSGFLFMSGLGLTELPYDLEWAQGRKASLMRNRIKFLELPCSCPTLSTLLLRHNTFLYDMSPSFFGKMRSLQVLDISFSGIVEISASLSHLVCLHTLFLQHCTSLSNIPSVENLKALRFMNLRGTSIKDLPEGMEKLVRLRFLDLSETKNLVNIREGVISSLWGLEELHLQGSRVCKMDTPQAANALKEMRCLTHLKILTLSAVGFGDHLDTITCLQKKNLVKFSIDMYGSAEDVVDGVKDI